jgi:hypothetical protein
MRKTLFATMVAVALGALVGCSTVEVSSDYDRTVDFSTYKTFDFAPAPEINNPLVYERIREAVSAELVAKGFTLEAGSPTLIVALHGRLSSETKMDTTAYGYGMGGWGYRGYYRGGYGGMGTASTTVREVPVGTLIVDIVDAKEKKLVWQGMASDSLDPKASADTRDRRVKDAVKQMLEHFPPVKK